MLLLLRTSTSLVILNVACFLQTPLHTERATFRETVLYCAQVTFMSQNMGHTNNTLPLVSRLPPSFYSNPTTIYNITCRVRLLKHSLWS